MKRRIVLALALIALSAQAFGQQITRVAVIDLQKVYMTYYKDSQAVRSLEEDKLRINDEIRRLNDEIKELQRLRLEVVSSGDALTLKTFDENLYRKAQFLSDFVKVKQAELDDKAKALSKGDAFVQMLYRTVQTISEKEGYSLVITSRDAADVGSSVIWFSPMIDITDMVIQALLGA
jgi:outer membrane protein